MVDDLGGPYHLIVMSNIVHGLGPEEMDTLMPRVRAALVPGGVLAIKDMFLDHTMARPESAALDAAAEGRVEYRKVRVPAHRYTPLRKAWPQIVTPLVEQLKLQVRFNPRSRCVELRSAPTTPDAAVGIDLDGLGNARACQCAAGTTSSYAPCAGRGGYDEISGDCAGLVCTQCPAASTKDRSACAACNATQGYSTDTNECTCAPNEILVETEGLNGTYAKTCVACAPGMFAVWEDTTKGGAFYEGDPYTCRRCPDSKMNADCTACAEGYTLSLIHI